MAKSGIENLLERHLQDLILPADDALINPMLGWFLGLLFLFSLFMIWRWNKARKTPRKQAIQKLKKLRDTKKIPQASALQLSQILREGLEVPRLDLVKPEGDQDARKWQDYTSDIEIACYAKQTNKIDIESLLNQANDWLRKA